MLDFARKNGLVFFILFINYFASVKCSHSSAILSFRIVGGGATMIKEHPYQVSILRGEKHHCGGSILNELFILTAAHCTYKSPHTKFTIRAGSSYWRKNGQLKAVIAKYEHPGYINSIFHNDICILKLQEPLAFNEYVQPVQLPEANMTLPPVGSIATVTGWGKLDYEMEEMSEQLMVVYVPLIAKDDCEKLYESSVLTRTMMCAGYADGGRDACIGDSGGPLTMDDVQIGIVSWGISCADPKSPGVYTIVARMRSFIDAIVES